MCQNLEMLALADCPESIRDTAELRNFLSHLRICSECRQHLKEALEFDLIFLTPLAATWRHLSRKELLKLRDAGFDPAGGEPQSETEWHLALCDECQHNLCADL